MNFEVMERYGSGMTISTDLTRAINEQKLVELMIYEKVFQHAIIELRDVSLNAGFRAYNGRITATIASVPSDTTAEEMEMLCEQMLKFVRAETAQALKLTKVINALNRMPSRKDRKEETIEMLRKMVEDQSKRLNELEKEHTAHTHEGISEQELQKADEDLSDRINELDQALVNRIDLVKHQMIKRHNKIEREITAMKSQPIIHSALVDIEGADALESKVDSLRGRVERMHNWTLALDERSKHIASDRIETHKRLLRLEQLIRLTNEQLSIAFRAFDEQEREDVEKEAANVPEHESQWGINK